MAIQNRANAASGLAKIPEPPAPILFETSAEWEGVRVVHCRVGPGEMPEHRHRSNLVFVPLAGAVTIEGEGEEGRRVRRRRTVGEISVTPMGARYGAQWAEELEHTTVYLSQEFLQRSTIDFEAHQSARLVLSCGPQDALVRSIGISLAAELDAGLPAGRLYAESLVNALTVHLLRHYSTDAVIPDLQFGGLPSHKLRRVTEFIDAHLDRDLALAEIAEEAHLSLYHFSRAFKQTTGQTPIQFVMQRRIERAKSLLASSELPLAEIALTVGFKNQSHFTTLFRKLTEMTPKAWRNAHAR